MAIPAGSSLLEPQLVSSTGASHPIMPSTLPPGSLREVLALAWTLLSCSFSCGWDLFLFLCMSAHEGLPHV